MARTLALLYLFALPVAGLAQGKLDQVRDAVDRPGGSSASSSSSKDKDKSDSSDSSSSSASAGVSSAAADGPGAGSDPYDPFRDVFLNVIGFPWMAPYGALDLGPRTFVRFAPYPYPDSTTQILFLDPPRDGSPSCFDRTDAQWWSARASAEVGSDFNGLDRVGLRLFLDTATRLGLKSDWDYYSERLPCGCRDDLWIGDVTATLRFVQNEWLQMHTGLGARFLVDHGRDRAGVNFLYGFDAFPVKPVHLFGSFEAGTLRHAEVYRVRGGVGLNWTFAELFAGYDFVWVGGVSLQGPMVGLRVWF